jgi:hypothetical protein
MIPCKECITRSTCVNKFGDIIDCVLMSNWLSRKIPPLFIKLISIKKIYGKNPSFTIASGEERILFKITKSSIIKVNNSVDRYLRYLLYRVDKKE